MLNAPKSSMQSEAGKRPLTGGVIVLSEDILSSLAKFPLL